MSTIWPIIISSSSLAAGNWTGIDQLAGDLHQCLPRPLAGAVLVFCSVLCGTTMGLERRYREKPAGLRTMTLICVGSTVFTLASILIAGGAVADRGRIAAQVVTGVGFLGAGAIMRDRGRIQGMTTGAMIWATAAIGVLIGAGFALAGLVVTVIMLGVLVLFRSHPD